MFFLADHLDWNRCSLTKEALKQAALFAKRGYRTTLLTFDFNAFYPHRRSLAYQNENLPKYTAIRNMHEELQGHRKPLQTDKDMPVFDIALYEEQGKAKKLSDQTYHIEQDGTIERKITLTEEGTLSKVESRDPLRRKCREDYDPWGALKRKTFMDESSGQRRQEIYYNKLGKPYLSIWYDRETGGLDKAHRLTAKGAINTEYEGNLLRLKADWLEQVLQEEKQPVVISHGLETDRILSLADAKHAVKILRTDAGHAKWIQNVKCTGTMENVKVHFEDVDGVFLHSEFQKKQLSERFGFEEKMYVIPHCPEQRLSGFGLFTRVKKDKNLAIALNWLDVPAGCEKVMKAFRQVAAVYPDAKLHYCGKPSEKSNFISWQKQLELEHCTAFCPLGTDAQPASEAALFTIIVSPCGDLSSPLLESMGQRTPVISFHELPQAAADQIEEEQCGYSVNELHMDKLAASMIHLFQHPARAMSMGARAKRFVEKHFNYNVYTKKWQTYVEEVLSVKKA